MLFLLILRTAYDHFNSSKCSSHQSTEVIIVILSEKSAILLMADFKKNIRTIRLQLKEYSNTKITFCLSINIYVTGPEKTSLIYTKYTCSYYIYLFFYVFYLKSVSCIEFLRTFYFLHI